MGLDLLFIVLKISCAGPSHGEGKYILWSYTCSIFRQKKSAYARYGQDERKWPHVAPGEVLIDTRKNLFTERVIRHCITLKS